jgi:hypothetical protein
LSAASFGGALAGASSAIPDLRNVTGRRLVCGPLLATTAAIKLKDDNTEQVF